MIVNDENKILIYKSSDFKNLDVSTRNYIYEKLCLGLLLIRIPDELKEQDKLVKNAYKIGFLDELLKEVYGSEMIGKNRYEIISEKYHMFYTYRRYSSFIKDYKELCI